MIIIATLQVMKQKVREVRELAQVHIASKLALSDGQGF